MFVPKLSAFTAVFCLSLSVASSRSQTPLSTEQQALIAADRGILEAMSGPKSDSAKVAQALAPEYTDVENGAAHSRAEVLLWEARRKNFSFQYENPHAIVLSPTSGYVIADVHYAQPFNGAAQRFHKMMTTVFALRDGRWLATLHVENPIDTDRDDILATPADSDPSLIAMRKLAEDVMSHVHVPDYGPFPFYPVFLDAGTAVSFSNWSGGWQAAHEADFKTLPPPMQHIWNQWASYTSDEPTGEALFKDMFHRFFVVHELGHLIAHRVIQGLPEAQSKETADNLTHNALSGEYEANRIAIAWFRESDPQYLARLVSDFRQIEAHLPNPVPAGLDPKRYFSDNYDKLGADPIAYGWFQLYMVISVYDEQAKTFQQIMDDLPNARYADK
jgi:hypothetical protein